MGNCYYLKIHLRAGAVDKGLPHGTVVKGGHCQDHAEAEGAGGLVVTQTPLCSASLTCCSHGCWQKLTEDQRAGEAWEISLQRSVSHTEEKSRKQLAQ